uniref:WH1 domain-containing protein n=1 Tax=Macrostomum lignano TaxID=282301 RepID=A0A1I8GJW6_9PLAT
LWAEVFTASDNDEAWRRLSDDVVPLNITADHGRCGLLLRLEAKDNRRSEPVLLADVDQRATRMFQATDCFVYWKDEERKCNYGLNFAASGDAEKFMDCFA